LNAGTGFYKPIDKGFDLNTAIGCYPNRAVLFNASDCFHSPLLYTAKNNILVFASDNLTPRISIIAQF